MPFTRNTIWAAPVGAVALALALAGCGGSNDTTEADQTSGTLTKQAARSRTVKTDTTPPSITIGTIGTPDANGAVSLSGQATDNLKLGAITWSNDLGGSGAATTTGGSTSVGWTFTTSALQFGTSTLTIQAKDAAGNTTSITQSVTRPVSTSDSGTSSGSTSGNTSTTTDWVKVADEGQAFTLGTSQTVRYGANTSWVTKTVSGTAPCTNAYFGTDPLYMTVKSCQVPATTSIGGSTGSGSTPTTPPPSPAPTLALSAASTSVTSGSGTTLNWSTSNASSCTASGAWSGAQATSGPFATGALSATSTYSLSCTGSGGSVSQSVTVGVTAAATSGSSSPITALDFPSNGSTSADIRFRFTGGNLLPMYPATYIWRVKVRKQPGYYTTFFWGPDGAFTGKDYYGAHPYPDGGGSTTGTHKWELSIWGSDVVTDASGNSTQLGYDVWRTQALRVWDNGSVKMHEFYWDLPDTNKVIRVPVDRSYGSEPPSNAALTFGDAPWSVGNERLSGLLRGLQLYSAVLSVSDIISEVSTPMSSPAGASSVWYLNLNPTPADISDKSGKAHHPSWVGANRASLWTGP